MAFYRIFLNYFFLTLLPFSSNYITKLSCGLDRNRRKIKTFCILRIGCCIDYKDQCIRGTGCGGGERRRGMEEQGVNNCGGKQTTKPFTLLVKCACTEEEACSVSSGIFSFWMYSFITAKHSRKWTNDQDYFHRAFSDPYQL